MKLTHPFLLSFSFALATSGLIRDAWAAPAEPTAAEPTTYDSLPSTTQPAPPPPAPRHVASITISPIHLIFPVLEVTAEYAVSPRFGVALIGGYGVLPVKTTSYTYSSSTSSSTSTTTTEHIKIWELGGHLNYYVVGSFEHGMQLGAEVLYVGASSDASSSHTAVTATGLALGPYAGYKIITRVGFTFEANLGIEYVTLQAKNESSSAKQQSVIPLLNLNVGWSFLRLAHGRFAARVRS